MENYRVDAGQSMETDGFPFPVPEHVRRGLESNSRWKWWFDEYGAVAGDGESTGLALLDVWREHLEELLAALDTLVDPEPDPYTHKQCQVHGIIQAMKRMCRDFQDLLNFTSETMPYDPCVQYRLKGITPAPEPEPTEDREEE